jgi:mono/diheme cytochrome c family protein
MAERLLARPDWASPTDARKATLAALAGCVMAERRPSRVERLLAALAAEPDGSWRRAALLDGAAPKKDAKVKLVYLAAPPAVMPQLLASADAGEREAGERLDAALAWPGKQGVPPPPVVKPLTPDEQARFERGKVVYAQTCGACHQPSGQGLEGLAPPLVDSQWVLGSPQRLTRIVLHGLTGPITVNGVPFAGEMPGLPTLSDDEVAAVLTYIRREWDHAADAVDEQTVARVREATKDRASLWTAKELADVK